MKDILIKDNFLDKDYFNHLQKTMLDDYFPWYYNDSRTHYGDGKYQFTHTLFRKCQIESHLFKEFSPFLDAVGVKSLVRLKANLTIKTPTIEDTNDEDYHMDFDGFKCKTGILYLNNNNGKNIFKNGFVSDSIENRFVCFPSEFEHTGTTHTDCNRRVVLNINWF